jgi:signal transduction histidine kinase
MLRADGFEASVEVVGDFGGLSDSQRIAALRVVQEALANVREHSEARSVCIRVIERDGRVDGTVKDDGRGFDVAAMLDGASGRRRFGLAGMHERVRLLGGDLRIESTVGSGTCVSFVLAPWSLGSAPSERPLEDVA